MAHSARARARRGLQLAKESELDVARTQLATRRCARCSTPASAAGGKIRVAEAEESGRSVVTVAPVERIQPLLISSVPDSAAVPSPRRAECGLAGSTRSTPRR